MAYRALHTDRMTKHRLQKSELRPKNKAALDFLEKWMSTPDEMGEEWWNEFEAELKANRFCLRRETE